MDTIVLSLGPAFAAGFALQQLLALLEPFLDKVELIKKNKKLILGLLSLAFGLVLAFVAELRILQPLGVDTAKFWDGIVTALVISAGTEGFNSIMKFLGYAKENKKGGAAEQLAKVDPEALAFLP
jgi:hypothetical protein